MPELSTVGSQIAQVTQPYLAVATKANKRMQALVTTADGAVAVAVAIAHAPAGYVSVYVNGVLVPELGDGTKVGAACYFSLDSGATARAWSAIAAGDTLHWNGSIAGYQLATSDVIDFAYAEER